MYALKKRTTTDLRGLNICEKKNQIYAIPSEESEHFNDTTEQDEALLFVE